MNRFWTKILSQVLFFWSTERRRKFRAGQNVSIRHLRGLRKSGIKIGKYTFISSTVTVRDKRSTIGSFCSVADGAAIGTGMHPLNMLTSNSITHRTCSCDEGSISMAPGHVCEFEQCTPVHIGNDVWIGMRAIIMDGVTVGDGAVIGSHAVVTKDVPPYAIVVGVPAKILRYRFDEATIARLLKSRWYERDYEFIRRLPMADIEKCLDILESTAE